VEVSKNYLPNQVEVVASSLDHHLGALAYLERLDGLESWLQASEVVAFVMDGYLKEAISQY